MRKFPIRINPPFQAEKSIIPKHFVNSFKVSTIASYFELLKRCHLCFVFLQFNLHIWKSCLNELLDIIWFQIGV